VLKTHDTNLPTAVKEWGNNMQPIKLLAAVALGSKKKADMLFYSSLLPPKKPSKAKSLRRQFKKEFDAYRNARARCMNPAHPLWKYYGGRGIRMRFKNFEEFFFAIGPCPDPKLTLDRIRNLGHYQNGNVQWASRSTQARNRRPKRPSGVDEL
jgi:hypothetical protein